MVPLQKLDSILCCSEKSLAGEEPSPRIHVYPYNTLGLLSSHLKPQFVAFNSGKKLQAIPYSTQNKLDCANSLLPSIVLLAQIYVDWMTMGRQGDVLEPELDCA